jgi:ankyrin repeat protein
LEIIKYLHENGADLGARGNRPMYEAIRGQNYKVVKYLHKNGVEFYDNVPNVKIYNLDEFDNIKLINYIMKHGDYILAIMPEYIFECAEFGRLDILKIVNDNYCDILDYNPNNLETNCLMCVACAYGHLELVKYLLELYKEYYNEEDADNNWLLNAFEVLQKYDHPEILEFLKENEDDITKDYYKSDDE